MNARVTDPSDVPTRLAPSGYNGVVSRPMVRPEPVFPADPSDEEGITRRDLIRVLFRHRALILTCFLAVTVIVGVGMYLLPPTYVAGATVLIRSERQGEPDFFSGVVPLSAARSVESNARRLETEMAVLGSAPLARETQRITGLTYDQVYRPPMRYFITPLLEVYDRAKRSLLGRQPYDRRGAPEVANLLKRSLIIRPLPSKSAESAPDVVMIGLPAADRRVAEQALDVLLKQYVSFSAQLNQRAGDAALAVVRAEAEDAERQLTTAEARLRTFRSTAGMRSTSTGDGTPAEDPLVTRLKTELTDARLALAAARRTFVDGADTVQVLAQSVADLQGRLAGAVSSDAVSVARELSLRREVRESETRFEELRWRVDQISLYLRANEQAAADRVVIEPPVASGSSDWKRRLMLAMAGSIAGLLLGLALAAVREYADQTMGTSNKAYRHLGIHPVATVPDAPADDVRRALQSSRALRVPAVNGHTGTRLTPVLRELATRVSHVLGECMALSPSACPARTVLVTSARPREGKSLVAGALAVQLAASGHGRVLLVEGSAPPGDAVDGEANGNGSHAVKRSPDADSTLADILASSGWQAGETHDPLLPVRLAAGHVTPALMNSSRLGAFLTEAGHRFEWVIIDGGSIGDLGVTSFARLADATLLVIDAQRTRRQVVRDALRKLPEGRFGIRGIVLNRQRQYIPTAIYERA